jgi:YYY domain-containing protein
MEYALVARWLVLYAALFVLGLPLVARLLPRADGRGAGLAVPAALVVLSVPAYWVGQVAWGPIALAAGVATLLLASGLAALDLPALREGRVRIAIDIDRAAATDAAAVFVLGFGFVVAIRAVDPAALPVGGEKFLDFGLLKTLDRSTVLPPEDFWFANQPVKYYYGGHLTATLLSWLTATPPRFAYNLSLAGFYAALVTAAFELAAAIGAERGFSRRVAGGAAAFFVGVASNLVTAGRLALLALPGSLERTAARYVAVRTDYTVETILAGAGSFSYWSASRVIPGTINEFPLFAWLNGDLHAHMMGTPTLLLAAAVGYAYYRTPASAVRRRRVLLFGVLPILAAWQAVVDTWSFPSVLALGWLAAVFAPAAPWTLLPATKRVRSWLPGDDLAASGTAAGETAPATRAVTAELRRVGGAFVVIVVGATAAAALAAPFLLGTATGGGERSVELLGPELRSGVGALLLVHGAFLVGLGGYLLGRIRIDRPWVLAGGVAVAAAVGVRIGFAALAVSVPLLVLAWVALRTSESVGYEAVLVVAAAGLVTLVEVVYVNEQAGPGRMNTVFKTYIQVWALFGTAMGVAVAGLWADLGATGSGTDTSDRAVEPATDTTAPVSGTADVEADPGAVKSDGGDVDTTDAEYTTAGSDTDGIRWRRVAVVGLVLALVASTGIYGVLAVGAHFGDVPEGGPTLDATEFVRTDHPEQAAAIAWIDAREGQPTMLEAPGTATYSGGTDGRERVMYSWGANPASSLTGVPTVAGWQHEVGYRGQPAYLDRVRDVNAMYTGDAATRAALLRQYEVAYIWVGPGERARYGSMAFEMSGIDQVHRSGDVTIYAVDRDALPEE